MRPPLPNVSQHRVVLRAMIAYEAMKREVLLDPQLEPGPGGGRGVSRFWAVSNTDPRAAARASLQSARPLLAGSAPSLSHVSNLVAAPDGSLLYCSHANGAPQLPAHPRRLLRVRGSHVFIG